jgi:MYXO-CTERM domain-containing protein
VPSLGRCGPVLVASLACLLAGCGGGTRPERRGQTGSALDANDQTAFDYFLGKGLTNFQAAGIVGNLDQESGDDPTAVQQGGPGRGIAQWSVGGRWDTDQGDNATWYAGTQNANVLALGLQLDFIWFELQNFSSYGLASLQATTNVTDATVAFETDFEGCGQCDQSTRITYAEAALSAYGSDTVDASTGPVTGTDAGVACLVTSLNMTGECILTTACAAMPGHVSTPGYCPGPADVECCTGPSDDGGTDAGQDTGAMASSGDSGGIGASDAGSPSAPARDAATEVDAGRAPGVPPRESPESSNAGSRGCSSAPDGSPGPGIEWWALGLVLAVMLRGKHPALRGAAAAPGVAGPT